MDSVHHKAFELLQRSIDGSLDAGERSNLERHLASCAECRTYAELHRRLEEQALQHRPAVLPTQKEIERTIRETRKQYRRWRMFTRLFVSPFRAVAWAGVAVALVLAVIWVFNIAPRQNQTGSPDAPSEVKEILVDQVEVTREVEVTRVVKEEVQVTPVFDAEAEKGAVVAVGEGVDDNRAVGDRDAVIAAFHEDLMGFYASRDESGTWTYQDVLDNPDWFTEPYRTWFDEYEVLVSPDLAVVFGVKSDQDGNRSRLTSVYKKEDGEWKVIHTHESYAYR